MTYETAIIELDKLTNDDAKYKEVYAHFGLAVFNAQLLEQQAINLIVFCRLSKDKSLTSQEINALWDSYDFGTKTLGALLNEIQQHYKLTDEDYAEFKELLRLRNYITHDYFRHNSGIWYAEGGFKRIIKDVYDFIEKRKKFDVKLNSYILSYTTALGLTPEMIQKIMDDVELQWQNKVIDDNHNTFHK